MNLTTIADLKAGNKAIIKSFSTAKIPLKLIEMGCIEGNYVEVIQIAPFKDPIYLNIGGTHLAIRLDLASYIQVEKI